MIGRTLFLITILITGIGLFGSQIDLDQAPEVSMTAPIFRNLDSITASSQATAVGESEAADQGWFIEDGTGHWTQAEKDMVESVVSQTLMVLEEAGINGAQLMAEYRFRRVAGEHADEALGLVALVNHKEKTIDLSDSAFLRMGGFYIYHELGHVADRQLDRRLSELFHQQGGGNDQAGDASKWQTADGYWLRAHAHEDREEATADAFALWVSSQAEDYRRPLFAGTPVNSDYQEIIDTMATAIMDISDSQAG